MTMFVVVQRRTLGTVAAILILAIVVGWAVRVDRDDGARPGSESGGGGRLEQTVPPATPPQGGIDRSTVSAVASTHVGADDANVVEPAVFDRTDAVESSRQAGATTGLEPYFEARLSRDRARSRRIEFLTDVVLGSDASEERKRESQQELDAILRRAEVEVVSEGIIRNQGFSNPLVFAGDDSVSVVVGETLESSGAARIGEAVARIAGVARSGVVIVDGGNVAAARVP